MQDNSIYRDIAKRTGGDIYIGVVGPVRTGKSTFIHRFLDSIVLPNIEDEYDRQRTVDEMPQSATGRTVMTTEPKFVPSESVKISIDFTVNLANVVARTGVNKSTINLGNFYPILCARNEQGFYECVYYAIGDPFYSDCADYRVNFIADKKFVVATSGKKTAESEQDGYQKQTFEIDNARSFAIVVSENFQSIRKTVEDTEIIYYYYNDINAESSMEYAVKSMNYFEKTF